MSALDSNGADGRVLLLAPTGRDAPLIEKVLGEAGVAIEACAGIEEFCRKLSDGAGAAFITEEALLAPFAMQSLVDTLRQQPAWSDFPLVVLTGGEEAFRQTVRVKRWGKPELHVIRTRTGHHSGARCSSLARSPPPV